MRGRSQDLQGAHTVGLPMGCEQVCYDLVQARQRLDACCPRCMLTTCLVSMTVTEMVQFTPLMHMHLDIQASSCLPTTSRHIRRGCQYAAAHPPHLHYG